MDLKVYWGELDSEGKEIQDLARALSRQKDDLATILQKLEPQLKKNSELYKNLLSIEHSIERKSYDSFTLGDVLRDVAEIYFRAEQSVRDQNDRLPVQFLDSIDKQKTLWADDKTTVTEGTIIDQNLVLDDWLLEKIFKQGLSGE